jgi:hypothetical protein
MAAIKQPFQGLCKRSKLLDKNVDLNYVTQNIERLDIKKEKKCILLESNQRPYGSEPSVLTTELVAFYIM